MIKRLLVLFAVVGATAVLASPTSAAGAGAMSFTQTFHNVTQSFTGPPMGANPCTGVPGTLTITYNGVAHVTFLTSGVGAGTGWDTFTATGDFTFTPTDPTQPSFTGQFTVWDGGSFNLENLVTTGILHVNGTGSDGSTLTFHDVFHTTVLLGPPPSVVVSFDKPSCG